MVREEIRGLEVRQITNPSVSSVDRNDTSGVDEEFNYFERKKKVPLPETLMRRIWYESKAR